MSEDRVVPKRKREYREKLLQYMRDHKSIIIVGADNIGSKQLQDVRISLRNRGVVLMGKNTLIRRILRDYLDEDKRVSNLIPEVKGNTGFVFTNEDLKQIRDVINSNTVPAAARPGVIAPQDVVVQPGATGLDPGQTAFFQSLNIPTKIVRGQIEMTNKTYLIKKGDKVGTSECALLNKLEIRPFFWSLSIESIYSDGSIIPESVLDISDGDLISKFFSGVRVIAALGLRLGMPNAASIPHSFANAFKKLLAISVQTDYTFEESKSYKEYLSDPDAYAAAHGIGTSAEAAPEEQKEEEAAAAPEESSSSSESEAGGGVGGLFGSDDDSDDDSD